MYSSRNFNLLKFRKAASSTRLLAAILAILALGLLAACGSSTPAPTPTPPPLAEELIFYDWEESTPQSVMDAFTEEYGVKITLVNYESQDEAVENMIAGEVYDVVVLENQFIPRLRSTGLLSEIDHQNVPNIKNISANFRDLAYDPGNKHSIPYNWGTTGLVVRSDLVVRPVTSWNDLWDSDYSGRVAIWRGTRREVIGLALKSLGYSVNSENSEQLEAALERLIEFKPNILFMEDFAAAVETDSSAPLLIAGDVVIGMGWVDDVVAGREVNEAITYVLPKEGAMLWGDNFVIPANSSRKKTAELFLNFLLRPEIAAQITNGNSYATPNEAAYPFIEPELLNDPAIFPPNDDLVNAEIILPLSPNGEKLHADIWDRFLAARL